MAATIATAAEIIRLTETAYTVEVPEPSSLSESPVDALVEGAEAAARMY